LKEKIKKKGEVMNDLISTAKLLGVSLSTIYRWLKRGKIEKPLRTFGNHHIFNENNYKNIELIEDIGSGLKPFFLLLFKKNFNIFIYSTWYS
jgi:excisionase family DNA binding protein